MQPSGQHREPRCDMALPSAAYLGPGLTGKAARPARRRVSHLSLRRSSSRYGMRIPLQAKGSPPDVAVGSVADGSGGTSQ